MTTAPAVTRTDEIVAELEREMKRCRFDGDEDGPDDPCIAYSVLEALLAERASLLADARRYRWLRDSASSQFLSNLPQYADMELRDLIVDRAIQDHGL